MCRYCRYVTEAGGGEPGDGGPEHSEPAPADVEYELLLAEGEGQVTIQLLMLMFCSPLEQKVRVPSQRVRG